MVYTSLRYTSLFFVCAHVIEIVLEQAKEKFNSVHEIGSDTKPVHDMIIMSPIHGHSVAI